jgi:predicted dehydrogenase
MATETKKVRAGLIGLGAIGRVHFDGYTKANEAELVALCDIDQRKLEGDWRVQDFNLGEQPAERKDLSGYRLYTDWHDIIADPDIEMIDICLPIPLHAEVAIAAMRAGKHVFCEKPMARTAAQCKKMEAVAEETGKRLMIGHCLRFWPEYLVAQEIIASGKYGKPLYARLHRAGGSPNWSYNNWLLTASESGGVVLDMHVHDVDAAIWWFGKPDIIEANGILRGDLPVAVDSSWRYQNGMNIFIHSAWDKHQVPGRWAYTVVMEHGTLMYDTLRKPRISIHTETSSEPVEIPAGSPYLDETEYFAHCLRTGEAPNTRVPTGESRATVEAVLEEIRQILLKNGHGQ